MTTFKDKIGASDLNQYDGVTRTFQRPTSSGGTLTQAKVGNTVDVLQVFGDGVTPTEQALRDALGAVGSLARTIELAPGTWPIAANLTTAANVTIIVRRGAVFSVSSGVTLNLSASFVILEASSGWYTGDGTVTALPANYGSYVSSNDTTAGYLNGKLTAGAGVKLTEGTDGGNETLSIGAGLVSSNDTTAGYLNGKLTAGANVTLTEGSNGGNETLAIAAPSAAATQASGTGNLTGSTSWIATTADVNAVSGETYFATGTISGTKGGTAGQTGLYLNITGSATAVFFTSTAQVGESWHSVASEGFASNPVGEITVTGNGALAVRIGGSSQGSDASISAAACKLRKVI